MAKRAEQLTERGDERRTQILRTALRLFAEHGIEGVGLRQIAQRVGIAQPALYHYFSSKDALVDATIEWRSEMNQERFSQAEFEPRQGLSLRQGLLDYLEHFHKNFADTDNDAIHRMMLSELARHSKVAAKLRKAFIEPQMKRLAGLFASLIAAGKVRDLDPDTLAVQFLGPVLLAGLAGDTRLASPQSLQRFIFQHLEVFIRGVEPR